MHLETISNGLGGQSMYMLWLAGQGRIPARVSITADTGSEEDCLWNTGERTTAKAYFERVAKPLADRLGVDARFVRVRDRDGEELPPIHVWMRREIERAKRGERKARFGSQVVPMFGSNGGRLKQTCTDKWKIAAIKQEARRLGAKHLSSHQGIHYGEAARRVKGVYLRTENGFDIYQDTDGVDPETRAPKIVKWMTHYYPLVDLKLNREQIRRELERLDIPYLITSECDMCPHKDLARWERTSPEKLQEVAELEALYEGEFFFTDRRVPLVQAIEQMKALRERGEAQGSLFGGEPDFGCGNSYCGV